MRFIFKFMIKCIKGGRNDSAIKYKKVPSWEMFEYLSDLYLMTGFTPGTLNFLQEDNAEC